MTFSKNTLFLERYIEAHAAYFELSGHRINGTTANAEHCLNMVMNSVGLITFLNPFIGHHAGDEIGKEAVKTGKNIRELVLEKNLLSEEELDRILSVENLMHPDYKAKLYK